MITLLQLHSDSSLACFVSRWLLENDKNTIEPNRAKVKIKIFFMFEYVLVRDNVIKIASNGCTIRISENGDLFDLFLWLLHGSLLYAEGSFL